MEHGNVSLATQLADSRLTPWGFLSVLHLNLGVVLLSAVTATEALATTLAQGPRVFGAQCRYESAENRQLMHLSSLSLTPISALQPWCAWAATRVACGLGTGRCGCAFSPCFWCQRAGCIYEIFATPRAPGKRLDLRTNRPRTPVHMVRDVQSRGSSGPLNPGPQALSLRGH